MKIEIDTQNKKQKYIDPTSWQNSTLRYAPPADFPAFLAEHLGRAKIMRVFITLDEYWDYRTDTYYPDYAIGTKRYRDSELYYLYDWEAIVPAPSGICFVDYLRSHSQNADELMLNVRRLEREVSDGIITYDQYENVFEKAVEYCKDLAPNIRYVECCNEVDLKTFGNLTAQEYMNIYERAYHVIKRLNKKHRYPVPLEIGGWALAKPFIKWGLWEDFLRLLAASNLGEKPIDFYSMHYYNQACCEGLERFDMDKEARELCAVDKLKLWIGRHTSLIRELGLPECVIFCNEIGGTRCLGEPASALKNASEVYSYLIASREKEFENFYMFPWCTFHNPKLQTSYTQFVRENDGSYSATPNGMAVLMLHKIKGDILETKVSECEGNDAGYRALGVANGRSLYVACTNPSESEEKIEMCIDGVEKGKYEIRQYLCDDVNNNCITGRTHFPEPQANYVVWQDCDKRLEISFDAKPYAFALYEIVRL